MIIWVGYYLCSIIERRFERFEYTSSFWRMLSALLWGFCLKLVRLCVYVKRIHHPRPEFKGVFALYFHGVHFAFMSIDLMPYNNWTVVMKKEEVIEAIVLTKKEKGLTWEGIASELGMGAVWVTSACLGMNSMPPAIAEKACTLFGLPDSAKAALEEFPTKTWDQSIPQDPLIYRLYEVVGVYGDTLKEVIQEKFGDGIMSAIDFSMDVDKIEDPKGDRVLLTLNGKFLPYKAW